MEKTDIKQKFSDRRLRKLFFIYSYNIKFYLYNIYYVNETITKKSKLNLVGRFNLVGRNQLSYSVHAYSCLYTENIGKLSRYLNEIKWASLFLVIMWPEVKQS